MWAQGGLTCSKQKIQFYEGTDIISITDSWLTGWQAATLRQ